jgi:hypothetical protein|tara:strand:- start:9 stop:179 length:171 start_codon:yes stop_codon:yes gene_type:complete
VLKRLLIYWKSDAVIELTLEMDYLLVNGNSSIKVSLTYLRGLEVPELKEEDMPVIE